MPRFILAGERQGKRWSVTGRQSFWTNKYYAVVQIGSTIKATEGFVLLEDAKDAGCQLLADTFAELEDLVDA